MNKKEKIYDVWVFENDEGSDINFENDEEVSLKKPHESIKPLFNIDSEVIDVGECKEKKYFSTKHENL